MVCTYPYLPVGPSGCFLRHKGGAQGAVRLSKVRSATARWVPTLGQTFATPRAAVVQRENVGFQEKSGGRKTKVTAKLVVCSSSRRRARPTGQRWSVPDDGYCRAPRRSAVWRDGNVLADPGTQAARFRRHRAGNAKWRETHEMDQFTAKNVEENRIKKKLWLLCFCRKPSGWTCG